jgi:tape measure domain-containing protein
MATDLERLVVQLSADVKTYERAIGRARGVTNREFTAIERRAKTMNQSLNNIGSGFGRGLAAPLAGVAAAFSVAEVIKYADAWKQAGNALKVSGVPADQLAGTLDRLFDIAQGAGADLGATVTLFSRLSQSANELGANQEQLFQFTKGVGDALKVAGTDAASASGALLQLSQALGGDIVRAEEFNSIMEGARPILQAVAAGIDSTGGSISKLRKMVLAGELTSKAFFEGFLKGSKGLASQAAQASTTFGQAFQKIENAFTKYIGQTDESLGASRRLIAGLEALANNFDATADIAIAFASILAAGLLGRSIGIMLKNIGLGIGALNNFVRAMRGVQIAAASTGGALASLGAAAGPLGALAGLGALAVTAALITFQQQADKAAAQAARVNAELEKMGLLAPKAADGVDEAAASVDKLSKGAKARQLKEFNDELERLRGGGTGGSLGDELGSIAEKARQGMRGLVGIFSTSDIDKAARETIANLADGFRDSNISAEAALATLEEMAKTEISEPVLKLNKELAETIKTFRATQIASTALGDTAELDRYRAAVKKARDEVVALFDHALRSIDRKTVSPEQLQQLEDLRDGLAEGTTGADEAKAALQRLASENYQFQAIASAFQPVLDMFAKAITAMDEFQTKAAGFTMPGANTPPGFMREGAQEETRRRSASAYLTERELLELRTAKEKELAELTEKIMKDAKEAGKAITEAEAAASARRQLENRETAETRSASTKKAFDLIAGYEKFRPNAYKDWTMRNGERVNSGYRVGFGSGTVTLDDGSIQKVTEGISTTLANATSNLEHRIETEFMPGVKRDIGAERFASFNADQQAVLTSIAYNYGSLPDRIIKAVKEGTTEDVYNAIRGLGSDNSGVNRTRRNSEAEQFLSGAPEGVREDITLKREQKKVYDDVLASIREETAAIAAETTMLGATNAQRERERIVREKILELQKAGITVTDEMRAAIEAEANARYSTVAAYDAAEQAAERLKQKQEDLQQLQQDTSYAFQGAMKSFISDMVHGKTATEALYNAVSQLADRLLDIALDQIFKSLFTPSTTGAGAGGGLFGALFSGLGFAGGGYTGDGGTNEPKGTVHGGEYVFSKKATSRIGRRHLDAMHAAAKRGYAQGGFVLPRINGIAVRPQAQSATPNVDARTTVINRFDAASFLSEAMAQPAGAKVILNAIKSQPAAFRAAMQG